jgi:hypothetical protein
MTDSHQRALDAARRLLSRIHNALLCTLLILRRLRIRFAIIVADYSTHAHIEGTAASETRKLLYHFPGDPSDETRP